MRFAAIATIVGLSIWTDIACAHDIGISRTELREFGPGTFQLRVEATPSVSRYFPGPVLPAHCEFSELANGSQGNAWKTWDFACSSGLSPEDRLLLPWNRDGIRLEAFWADGSTHGRLFKNEAGIIEVRFDELRISSGSVLAAASRYTILGIEHILEGYDHLLFVLALVLIVSSGWRLVKTITAFTVAHSITLALATLGFVEMPSRPVEAAIALSIVFLAVEIVHAREGRYGLTYTRPWLIAFSFGLLHGFGFAGALSDIGLPQAEIPISLLFFNIGVELGQLLFVIAAIAVQRLLAPVRLPALQRLDAVPAYLIGTLATYWLLERVAGMFPALAA